MSFSYVRDGAALPCYPILTMRLFKFAAPKGPGYGISQQFRLDVLAGKPTLPTMLELVNPKGEAGAVAGFGVPLASGTTRDDLAKPLIRGIYGVATPDRKTVLQMMIMSADECGFDPEGAAQSAIAANFAGELVARIRATWNLVQFTFKSHDASVAPAMAFVWQVARRLGELTDGCIADSLAERYVLPAQVAGRFSDLDFVQAPDHLSVKSVPKESGLYCYTRGMAKFALPEVELQGVEPSLQEVAETFLLGVCQGALSGRLMRPGDVVGARANPFQVAEGGLDRRLWEGIPVYELLPPTGKSSGEALRAWGLEGGR